MIEYRIYSLMRSGHHAIMNWMFHQFSGSVVFANNITGVLWNPGEGDLRYKEFYDLFSHGMADRSNMVDIKCDINKCSLLPIISKGDWKNPDVLMYSIEDDPVANFEFGIQNKSKNMLSFQPGPNHKSIGVGCSNHVVDVLIIRDPVNFIASRFKRQQDVKMDMLDSVQDIWLSHGREFFRDTKILDNPILINFNQWSSSKEYREDLAGRFEKFIFSDAGFEEIPAYGGGSSFEKIDIKNVNLRYKKFINDKNFVKLLTPEIRSYGLKFGVKLSKIFI